MNILISNAYRILGLPITASQRDIVRRVDELQAYMKIGQTPQYDSDLLWMSELNRNDEEVKKAYLVLENKDSKLIHLLSWFWIIDKYDKLAFDALEKGEADEAIKIWTESTESEFTHHKKNLASIELILAHQTLGSDSDHQHLCRGLTYWTDLTATQSLFDSIKNFDSELAKHIRGLNTINFTADFFSQISKPFLNDWIDKDSFHKVKKLFSVLDTSELPQKTMSTIKEDYLNPLTEKIDKLCSEFINSKCDIEELYIETKEFYEKVKPHFNKIILANDSFFTELCGDKIGKIILDKAIQFGNEMDQWEKCEQLCELVEFFATGPVLRNRLEKNFEVISDNVKQKRVLGDLKPIEKAPFNDTFYGIGTMLYGRSNYDPVSKSYETTRYFVLLYLPIVPLARYRVIHEGEYIRYLGKLPFRPLDKWHLGFVILAIIIGLIYFSKNSQPNIYKSIIDKRPTSTNRINSKELPSSSPSRVPPSSSGESRLLTLKTKIDNDKKRLESMEINMSFLNFIIDDYSSQLQKLKGKIEEAEQKSSLGLYVNESDYKSNINKYNNLVEKYNSTLMQRKERYQEYSDLFDEITKNIELYNSLVEAAKKSYLKK